MGSDYIIGSFNLLKLNFESKGGEKKSFELIAKIINDENFDVVALQEVPSETAIKLGLIPHLGSNKWDYCWEQPRSISNQAREGYAYIWKKRRLRLVDGVNNPYIDEKYSNSKADPKVALVRPPYVIRLTPLGKPGGIGIELRLINTHITFGKSLDTVEITNEALRKAEFKVLTEQIYPRVATLPFGEGNTAAYTFLLGDYNLVLSGPGYKINELVEIDYRNPYRKRLLLTVQDKKTSLKRIQNNEIRSDEETEESELLNNGDEIYSRNYDHFSYGIELKEKMRLEATRVEAVQYCDNDLQRYRISVSDHVPIKLSINFKNRR